MDDRFKPESVIGMGQYMQLAKAYRKGGAWGIPRDIKQAYVWYSLAEDVVYKDWDIWQLREIRKEISTGELSEAEHMLKTWKPGQCEQYLTGDAHELAKIKSAKSAWKLNKEKGTYCSNADLGYADAQTYVGDLYYIGAYGLEKNFMQAFVWYSLAAKNGNSYAAIQLEKVVIELSPDQLVEVQHRLEQWEPGQCESEIDDMMGKISEKDE